MSQNYCIVYNCRFPDTHTTSAHKCGKCGKFGHGQMECGDQMKIDQLKSKSIGIRFPSYLRCTSMLCPCPWTHSDPAHYCVQCGERHLESKCPRACVIMGDPNEITRVITEAKKIFGTTPGNIFTKVYSGQGCDWYVKRKDINKSLMLFFMHGDAWGQFGPQCDDRQHLDKFCSGYREIKG